MPQPTRLFGLAGTPPGGPAVPGGRFLPILGPGPENPESLLEECGLEALVLRPMPEGGTDGLDRVQRIALIGPMGVGKSSVGRALARLSGLPFADADEAIAAEAGLDIPAIFAQEGEAGFRARESRVLAALLRGGPLVLATGGGAVLDPGTRALLKESARVVWLHAPASLLASRVGGGAGRPLLSGRPDGAAADVAERLAAIYRLRLPYYAQCADFLLPVGRSSPQTLAEVIHDAVLQALKPLW